MMNYFDYIENNTVTLSQKHTRAYNKLIALLVKYEVDLKYIKVAQICKNKLDTKFIDEIILFMNIANKNNFSDEEKKDLLIECIRDYTKNIIINDNTRNNDEYIKSEKMSEDEQKIHEETALKELKTEKIFK
jgi:hypothetical protein